MASSLTRADLDRYLGALEQFGVKLGLENITRLCEALDHPEHACRSIIVAGTNGKGSVCAMIDTALRAAGYRVARYTSPHLQQLEERFVIDGQRVSSRALRDAVTTVRTAVETLRAHGWLDEPTFFEVTTAAAFVLFRWARVDVAVLEVGLGGRFDATNVANPIAAAIPSIDLDHQQQLGSTIRSVAHEKAGVVKPGMVVVVGEPKTEVVDTFRTACQRRGARLVSALDGVTADLQMVDGRTALSLATPAHEYESVLLGLRGRHQAHNAIVAVRLLEELGTAGLNVPTPAVRRGLTEVTWRGRLELLAWSNGRELLVDAAHNPAGANALARYLGEVYPGGLPIVFGAMRDKDVDGMFTALSPHATRFICTTVGRERALPASAVASLARQVGLSIPVEVQPDVRAAVGAALIDRAVVCATGSIFLIGEILDVLDRAQHDLLHAG